MLAFLLGGPGGGGVKSWMAGKGGSSWVFPLLIERGFFFPTIFFFACFLLLFCLLCST